MESESHILSNSEYAKEKSVEATTKNIHVPHGTMLVFVILLSGFVLFFKLFLYGFRVLNLEG